MSRIVYVNGHYALHGKAAVHVEDRGFQFADGVYEVIAVRAGKLVDEARHMMRLGRSLNELQIALPMSPKALGMVMAEVIARNRVREGIVYLQINRGVARRDHSFPAGVRPSIVVMARSQKIGGSEAAGSNGIKVISRPDIRWGRCDIKSVSLLPNVLAKQEAKEAGAYEAWLVDEAGYVTEGSSTNAWIVTAAGEIVTRRVSTFILPGITRAAVFDLAKSSGLKLVERSFSLKEARSAKEAFLTSTTSFVLPVVELDGKKIGKGKPGPVTLSLRALYSAFAGE